MLRMPEFRFLQALDAAHAVQLFHELGDAMYVAGGTDLLPNIKHRLFTPRHVVGLGRLPAGIAATDSHLVIEGQANLHALATSRLVQQLAPPLATAAGLVAGPQLRRMGTIGGNILLDTLTLSGHSTVRGIGVWTGLLMVANLWFVLWPHQKKVLGYVPATVEERLRCSRITFLSSRTNTVLSVPTLFLMVASTYGTVLIE